METLIAFASQYGAYSFKAYLQQDGATHIGSSFTTKMFHLTADGQLKKLVFQGQYWKQDGSELVEETVLTEQDFVGKEDVLATLIAEIADKQAEYTAAANMQEAQLLPEFPL